MSKTVNLGGDRIGSGNKMQEELHDFYRSNHNLNAGRFTTMAPGVLYPVYVLPAMPDDSFDFDISAFMRTVPTKGPLYGSFKLQVDFFAAPIRLYQGILHNNPTRIGLQMQHVKLPMLEYKTLWDSEEVAQQIANGTFFDSQTSPSSLLRYCGFAGAGRGINTSEIGPYMLTRKINAVPMLAYYDIFKNYYANKQEENAFVISPIKIEEENPVTIEEAYASGGLDGQGVFNSSSSYITIQFSGIASDSTVYLHLEGKNFTNNSNQVFDKVEFSVSGQWKTVKQASIDQELYINGISNNELIIAFKDASEQNVNNYLFRYPNPTANYVRGISLQKFPLENIDKMRETLLGMNRLGQQYVISENDNFPYKLLAMTDQNDKSLNIYPLNGLCVKTYQSDMFNNWLDTEMIDGENGINAITAIDTSGGSFTIDDLNLANKVYKMLNRIAISGGTYQDWLEAVYSENVIQQNEIPMYLGGMSAEVVFDEVISTAASGNEELGTLAGRGNLAGEKGGKIVYKPKEPMFIIGMVSITPRITYSQGNAFYMTEYDSVDDMHKPSLDGIGFQDLLVEKMTFNGTVINEQGSIIFRQSAGKQTAWIDYQTDVDKCFGDFAQTEGKAFMVLNRLYDCNERGEPTDITTYIDPEKYNYVFANTELESQNFWAFFKINNQARRLMAASQIPNL